MFHLALSCLTLLHPASAPSKRPSPARTNLPSPDGPDEVGVELKDLRRPQHGVPGQREGEVHQLLLCLRESDGRARIGQSLLWVGGTQGEAPAIYTVPSLGRDTPATFRRSSHWQNSIW